MKWLIYPNCYQRFGQFKILRFLMSTVQSPAFKVQSPASNVWGPASNAQGPASKWPVSRVQRPESSVQSPEASVQGPASNTCVQSPGILICLLKWTKRISLYKWEMQGTGKYINKFGPIKSYIKLNQYEECNISKSLYL